MAKSLSEVLKKADAATTPQQLSTCWKYLCDNRYQFPLVQLYFAREHIENLARQMARRDVEMIRPYLEHFKDFINER
jgi:hypothetical protein